MDSVWFTLKALALTFIVTVLMQIKWGTATIEDHTIQFITTSGLVKPVDDTANGAVVFIRNSWNQLTKYLNTNFTNALRSENRPGSRQNFLSLERSEKASPREKMEAENGESQSRVNRVTSDIQARAKKWAEEAPSSAKTAVSAATETSSSYFSQLKDKMREVNRKVQSKFVDETRVPGEDDEQKASYTNDDAITETDEAQEL